MNAVRQRTKRLLDPDRLAAELKRRGHNPDRSDMAGRIGVHRSTVSRWFTGQMGVGPDALDAIEQVYGIGPDAYTERVAL